MNMMSSSSYAAGLLAITDEASLIKHLVDRISSMVVSLYKDKDEQTSERVRQASLRTQNEEALLEMSQHKLNVAAGALLQVLENLPQSFDDSEEGQSSLAQARIYLLNLLATSMASAWQYLKKEELSKLGDVEDKNVLKQKEEQVAAPNIDDNLAVRIWNIAVNTILKPPGPHHAAELRDKAGRVLFQVSASKFDILMGKLGSPLSAGDEVSSPLNLIEYLNLNSTRLTDILQKVLAASEDAPFKKDNLRILLARVLTRAIWNWIDNYPMEFVSLSQNGTKLPGKPDELFDVFVGWSGKNKKGHYWEIQTMLLILCPDIMFKVAKSETTKETATKEKFMHNLNKALKGKLADIAVVCYVNIFKASTFVTKQDSSALRFTVTAIEPELKERLFNPASPFKPSDGNEVQIMTDCLLASFRLSHVKGVKSFTDLLAKDFPPVYKLVLVNTLQRIVDEGASITWNATITDAYPVMAPQLRVLFQELVESVRSYNELRKQTNKQDKKAVEAAMYNVDILRRLIKLFKSDPILPLHPQGKSWSQDLEATRSLLKCLCLCASWFFLPELSQTACSAIVELHRPKLIERWVPSNQIAGFWDISSHVLIDLSDVLIEKKSIKLPDLRQYINLFREILAFRNEFLATHKEQRAGESAGEAGASSSSSSSSGVTSASLRANASTKIEVALLIQLCSGETEIVTKVENCLGLLCDEIDTLSEADSAENSIASNLFTYKKLASASALLTGRAAQQRTIRIELRRIRQTQGNFRAWEEVYKRWARVSQVIIKGAVDEKGDHHAGSLKKAIKAAKPSKPASITPSAAVALLPPEVLIEWNHYSGFLCAVAGVCLSQERVVVEQSRKGATETKVKIIDAFIDELLELLVSNIDVVRETTTELLGSTLSPTAYSVLFHHLNAQVKTFFGTAGQINYSPEATTFADQAISVIKHILELPVDSYTADDLALLTDFEEVITNLMKYVSQLVIKDNPAASFRIKSKMCACLEAMMQKHQFISFGNEFQFRHRVVEIVMEWISDFNAAKPGKTTLSELTPEKQKEVTKGTVDLDVAAVKAIAALFKGLPVSKEDAEEAETSTLGKYFTFFTRLLTRAKSDPNTPRQKADMSVMALSNLLSANIDSALEYFVTMGYHEDLETRASFLKVLTNILNQGTEFDSLAEEGDKFDKLLDLVLDPKLEVVLALCAVIQITEADEVAQLLVRLFEANERTMMMLKMVIEQEVSKTETENTLFRRNSMATKLLAAYTKLIGTRYLKDTLTPTLQRLIANPPPLELDPQKLPAGQDRATNIENVTKAADDFLKAIEASVEHCPVQFREICAYLQQEVGKRFPGAEHAAIGGFIYLRFICPAIVSPDGYGLVQSRVLTPELRRGLILTTKVLQNLANKVMFTKEPYMEEMNGFLKENMNAISGLFDKFAQVPAGVEPTGALAHVSDEQREEDVAALHYHLSLNLEGMRRVLTSVDSKQKGSHAFLGLTSVLAQLGPPAEPTKQKSAGAAGPGASAGMGLGLKGKAGGNTNLHAEFMAEMAKQMSAETAAALVAKKIFYKQGVTKDKQPVFYYIARRLDKADRAFAQLDALLFHILKTVQPDMGKKFVLVVDCTLFNNKEHELPYAWITKFRQVAPGGLDNLSRVFLVNVNHCFKKYSKRIGKLLSRAKSKMEFLPSVSALAQHIPEKELGLPTSTLAVDRDVKATFSPVQKLMQYSNQKEVIIRISTNLVEVITAKQHSVLGKRVPLSDLYPISSMFEINHAVDTHEVVIKYYETDAAGGDRGAVQSLAFKCPASDRIVMALKASKARLNLAKPAADPSSRKRSFRASDVPGTLLNMALLNLGNTNAALRVEAYNLLASLCASFNLSVQLHLWETSGLAIPRNTNSFIVGLSKKLARTEANMTLEFLIEALHGIEKIKANLPGKQLCLNYLTHWLPNLRDFCLLTDKSESALNIDKTTQIVAMLMDFTIKETSMTGPAIQTKVWEVIGAVPELLDLVIEVLLARAFDRKQGGSGSTALSVIADIFVSMATRNARLIAGKLLARLLRLLPHFKGYRDKYPDGSSNTTTTTSDESSSSSSSEADLWFQLDVLVRILLMLSFDNLVHVQQYLPELFHAVLLLFATGPPVTRATVHGLLINIVHSLYTTLVTADNKLQSLRLLLAELNQPKMRVLFGLGGQAVSAFTTRQESGAASGGAAGGKPESSSSGGKAEPAGVALSISTVETVAGTLLGVLNACSPSNNCVGTPWHARLLSLATKAAFTPNPVLQPRAIVAVGVLCSAPSLVTDDLMAQVLVTLRDILPAVRLDLDLPMALIICLTRLFEHLPPTSRYFRPMFWVALTLLQIDEPKIFAVAIGLLEVVLRRLDRDSTQCINDGLVQYCMQAREEGGLETALAKADQMMGVSFKTSFSFAVTAHLLKGLRAPATKTSTARVLSMFVDICAKKAVGSNLLGYLAALLPIQGEEMEVDHIRQILLPAGPDSGNLHHYLIREEMLPDNVNAALLFTLLVTILKSSDSEHEQLFIYESLREGIVHMPDAFPVVYDILVPKMALVMQNSQNQQIIDACLAIMQSMFKPDMQNSKKRLNKDYVHAKLGFQGLIDSDTFSKPAIKTDMLTKVACQVLETIIGA